MKIKTLSNPLIFKEMTEGLLVGATRFERAATRTPSISEIPKLLFLFDIYLHRLSQISIVLQCFCGISAAAIL
jgi:hypothetical protein